MITRTFTAADLRPDLGRFSPSAARIPAVIRRAVDIVVSTTALAVASPVLALAALAIRLESPGPVIYRQRRSGLHGREFDVIKLRTMVDGAEHIGAGLAITANDARITRVGAFLRRTSLDELPNLRERAARGDVADRPPPDVAGAGRAVHRAPARAPRGEPGITGGRRSTAARRCRGASGSSSTSTTSSTERSSSTCGS